jgi:hypothetical protein
MLKEKITFYILVSRNIILLLDHPLFRQQTHTRTPLTLLSLFTTCVTHTQGSLRRFTQKRETGVGKYFLYHIANWNTMKG